MEEAAFNWLRKDASVPWYPPVPCENSYSRVMSPKPSPVQNSAHIFSSTYGTVAQKSGLRKTKVLLKHVVRSPTTKCSHRKPTCGNLTPWFEVFFFTFWCNLKTPADVYMWKSFKSPLLQLRNVFSFSHRSIISEHREGLQSLWTISTQRHNRSLSKLL